MRVAIVGGNAAGATAAARLRRSRPDWEILLFERGGEVSFANCGLPYYLEGVVRERTSLFAETSATLASKYRIDIRLRHEAVGLRPSSRELTLRELSTGRTYTERYDKLLLATGASPVRPAVPGAEGKDILCLWSPSDMDEVARRIHRRERSAAILGAGRIGCLLAEALLERGLSVDIIEARDQVLWPMDGEIASHARSEMESKGVKLRLGDTLTAAEPGHGSGVDLRLQSGNLLHSDFLVLCAGSRPNSRLALEAGLEIGETGGIAVGPGMRTSDPDIYAAGDVVEVVRSVSGLPAPSALAGPGQIQGRIAADNIAAKHPGWEERFEGCVGSAILRLWRLSAGLTGAWTEELERAGIPFRSVLVRYPSAAPYMPTAAPLYMKLFFGTDGSVLGAHAAGTEGVDKRLDVISTAIQMGARVSDLERLQLCYAPGLGTARDAVNVAGSLAVRALRGATPG